VTAQYYARYQIGIGTICQIALQIASKRSGVDFGRKMILFMDRIIIIPSKIISLDSALIVSEANGINILIIGIGITLFHLHDLFQLFYIHHIYLNFASRIVSILVFLHLNLQYRLFLFKYFISLIQILIKFKTFLWKFFIMSNFVK
jgi:hypothetical protein